MKEQLFDELLASVGEAGQILRGERKAARSFKVHALNVQDIRQSLGLSQSQFAGLIHVSVKTLGINGVGSNLEPYKHVPAGTRLMLNRHSAAILACKCSE